MARLILRLEQYPDTNPFTGTRRKILRVLSRCRRPITVSETSRRSGVPMGTLSHELKILEDAGLVKSQRSGREKRVVLTGWPVQLT